MPPTPYATKETLAPQDAASRLANIEHELLAGLSLRFGIDIGCGCRVCRAISGAGKHRLLVKLDELGLRGTSSDAFAKLIATRFPFVTAFSAASIVSQADSISDVVYMICEQVGPYHDSTPAQSVSEANALFAASPRE